MASCGRPQHKCRETKVSERFAAFASETFVPPDRALDHAPETLARERLTDLSNRLDHAVESIEQRVEHEREREEATAEIEATYERRQRIQRVAIVVLLRLVLLLAAYGLLTP